MSDTPHPVISAWRSIQQNAAVLANLTQPHYSFPYAFQPYKPWKTLRYPKKYPSHNLPIIAEFRPENYFNSPSVGHQQRYVVKKSHYNAESPVYAIQF